MTDIKVFEDKDLVSFGGDTLPANLVKAENAIVELERDFKVFNHSNSQTAWQLFILNHKGGLRNVRQISAEISRKRDALIEAKYNHLEALAEVDIWKEELEIEESPAKRRLLEIKIERVEQSAQLAIAPIEGALKDIIQLHAHYTKLMEQYDGYTEEDFEKEEVAYWIKRCISQCLRDIRQFNTVTKGEQEPLESMGLNVLAVIDDMRRYLNDVEMQTVDGSCLDTYLEECVEKYSSVVQSRLTFIREAALIEESTDA